jgi:hypothetical protein
MARQYPYCSTPPPVLAATTSHVTTVLPAVPDDDAPVMATPLATWAFDPPRSSRRRLSAAAVAMIALPLLVLASVVGWRAAEHLREADDPQPAPVVVSVPAHKEERPAAVLRPTVSGQESKVEPAVAPACASEIQALGLCGKLPAAPR